MQALIICDVAKSSEFYKDFLKKSGYERIVVCERAGTARQKAGSTPFDLVVVNAPLLSDSAEDVAKDLAERNESQILLMVKNEYLSESRKYMEKHGIITVGKPVRTDELRSALSFAAAAQQRIAMVQKENQKLQRKLNELKIITRAKILLMQNEGLSEEEAHKKIERFAMEDRVTRLSVAKEIINRYE